MISAVIATRNRPQALSKTLRSIAAGQRVPDEIILIDASDHSDSADLAEAICQEFDIPLIVRTAEQRGAAAQRNQGVALASGDYLLFIDDDIVAEHDCLYHLHQEIVADPEIGGACATITNQTYSDPGKISGLLFRWLNRGELPSYAGRCIGPAKTFHPAMDASLPSAVAVDWLPTTAVMYRRKVLPVPPFPPRFEGASLAEDLALSLVVGRSWKLINARKAEILHESHPGDHKLDEMRHAEMELLNRHYIMTTILQRSSRGDYLRLLVCNLFEIVGATATSGANPLLRLQGNFSAWLAILKKVNSSNS